MPRAGLEPACRIRRGILSPLRLPISPSRRDGAPQSLLRLRLLRTTNEDALAGEARAFVESVDWVGWPTASSVAGVLEPDLQAVRALEAGGVPDVEGVRVHVIVDALGDLRVAIQELAEEGFGDFLLENRRLRLQGAALLVTRWRAFRSERDDSDPRSRSTRNTLRSANGVAWAAVTMELPRQLRWWSIRRDISKAAARVSSVIFSGFFAPFWLDRPVCDGRLMRDCSVYVGGGRSSSGASGGAWWRSATVAFPTRV